MFKVYKFGGSVLKNATDIRNIYNIISTSDKRAILVFSAFFEKTDALISVAKIAEQAIEYDEKLQEIINFHKNISLDLDLKLDFLDNILSQINEFFLNVYYTKNLSAQKLDYIMSFGERLSTLIIAEFFKSKLDVVLLNAQDIIKTDSNFGAANVDFDKTVLCANNILNKITAKYMIFAGFIGSDSNDIITTLGRNGSDYSAAIISSIIKANKLEIWKDIDGLYTADPKIVKDARFIDMVSYKEMEELAYFGNKVIAIKAMQPIIDNSIAVYVKNVKNPFFNGTLISNQTNIDHKIKGVTKVDNCTLFEIAKLDNITILNFSERIYDCLLKSNIHILFYDNQSFICVKDNESFEVERVLSKVFCDEITNGDIVVNKTQNQSIIAIISHDVCYSSEVSKEVFNQLIEAKININAVGHNMSTTSITCIVDKEVACDAINIIHSFLMK